MISEQGWAQEHRQPAVSVNMVSVTNPKIPPAGRDDLRKAANDARAAVSTRDAFIRYWHREGASLREIADALGTITHSAVARIVKRG